MARTGIERETIITYNEAEPMAHVYTFNVRLKHRLANVAEAHPDECKFLQDLHEGAVEYEVPKKWVKINPSNKQNLTDEQRKARAEQLARIRIDSEARRAGK